MALHACTGIEGFYVAVRGGIEDLAALKIFFTEKAQKFVQDVLEIEPQHLGLKLEAFVISKLGVLFFSIIPYPTDSPKMNACHLIIKGHSTNLSASAASLFKMN